MKFDKNNQKIATSYSVKHEDLKLVEPKITDYFLESNYFKDKAINLMKKTFYKSIIILFIILLCALHTLVL